MGKDPYPTYKVMTHTSLRGGCQMSLNKKKPRLQPNEKGTKITKRSTGIVIWHSCWDHARMEGSQNKDGTILDVNDSLTDNVDQQEDTHNAELPDPQENTARPH